MNILPMTIESLVAVLLLLTILYCVRLNEKLSGLKEHETTMRATIAELVTATETAERAIAGLKATVREADQTLGERLRAAERVSDEIGQMTEVAHDLLNRTRKAPGNGVSSAAPAAKAAAPDPRIIAKAAQAFADRAQARLKRGAAA